MSRPWVRDRLIAVEITLPRWSRMTGLEVATYIVPDDDPPIGEKLVPISVVKIGPRTLKVCYEEPKPDFGPAETRP